MFSVGGTDAPGLPAGAPFLANREAELAEKCLQLEARRRKRRGDPAGVPPFPNQRRQSTPLREEYHESPCAAQLAWGRGERENQRPERRLGEPIDDLAAKHGALPRRVQPFADDDENERPPARTFGAEKVLERLPRARCVVPMKVTGGGRRTAQRSALSKRELATRTFDRAVRVLEHEGGGRRARFRNGRRRTRGRYTARTIGKGHRTRALERMLGVGRARGLRRLLSAQGLEGTLRNLSTHRCLGESTRVVVAMALAFGRCRDGQLAADRLPVRSKLRHAVGVEAS